MVQTGDPTGTGKGGESIYGGNFKDEFNSRLKFTQRGLVAMANTGIPNDNASQFFITLNECQWLDEKHTIFGMIKGDTIFNLLAIGNVDTDESDRPIEPIPRIISTEVIVNPFKDVIIEKAQKSSDQSKTFTADEIKQSIQSKTEQKKTEKVKTKATIKNKNLISFQDEEEEELGLNPNLAKRKSD